MLGLILPLAIIPNVFPLIMSMELYSMIETNWRMIRKVMSLPEMVRPEKEVSLDVHKAFEFKEVNFAYEEGIEVLHHANFQVKHKSVFAIVEESGSGKSTIAKLMTGYFDEAPRDTCKRGVRERVPYHREALEHHRHAHKRDDDAQEHPHDEAPLHEHVVEHLCPPLAWHQCGRCACLCLWLRPCQAITYPDHLGAKSREGPQVMGHEQDCHAPFGVRFTDQPIKDLAALAVKPVGGLIQYEQARVAHQGAGQAHTLKLSSRKLTDEVTHEASHANSFERCHAALVALFTTNL